MYAVNSKADTLSDNHSILYNQPEEKTLSWFHLIFSTSPNKANDNSAFSSIWRKVAATTSSYLVQISQGFIILHHHLGKLQGLLWIDTHQIAQQEDVVWCEAHLLRVKDNFLELSCLCKALDNLLEGCNQINSYWHRHSLWSEIMRLPYADYLQICARI